MRSVQVNVYDEEWLPQGTGLVYQSLDNETTPRIGSAIWGRFLNHLPIHRDRDFYRLEMDDQNLYVSAKDGPLEKWFHSTLFPVCENNKGDLVGADKKPLSEEDVHAYKARNVYLTMDSEEEPDEDEKEDPDSFSSEYDSASEEGDTYVLTEEEEEKVQDLYEKYAPKESPSSEERPEIYPEEELVTLQKIEMVLVILQSHRELFEPAFAKLSEEGIDMEDVINKRIVLFTGKMFMIASNLMRRKTGSEDPLVELQKIQLLLHLLREYREPVERAVAHALDEDPKEWIHKTILCLLGKMVVIVHEDEHLS